MEREGWISPEIIPLTCGDAMHTYGSFGGEQIDYTVRLCTGMKDTVDGDLLQKTGIRICC